jgi:signal transduction histidine kinase
VNLTFSTVATSVAWAAAGGVAAWLLTWPLSRRSVTWLIVSVAATGTAASFAALLGAVHSMLLPMGQTVPVVLLSAAAGAVALAAAIAAGRRVSREHRAVADGLVRLVAEGTGENAEQPDSPGTLTEQLRKTSEALARSREQEDALNRSRRELIAWISHDLRTPLAGLRAMTEALEDDLAPDPHMYYKQMNGAVDRLSSMVDDLFELSRVQAAASNHRVQRVDLGALLQRCVAELEPLSGANGVALCLRLRACAVVLGRADELHRALTNVLANGLRHTPHGGAVHVCADEDGTGAVEITVQDECGGIAEDALPRVFDVGYRGDAARAAADGGAGLGLAITRGVVQAHGGGVSVSNVQAGCRFRIVLPALELSRV